MLENLNLKGKTIKRSHLLEDYSCPGCSHARERNDGSADGFQIVLVDVPVLLWW